MRRAATAGAVAGLLVAAGAGPVVAATDAAPSASPSSSASSASSAVPDPDAMAAAEQALAADLERVASTEITDTMRAGTVIDLDAADATVDLRADDATFPLRPEDSTTVLEQQREEKDDTVVTLTSDLLFDFGKATLTPEAKAAVAELAAEIPQDATVRVDGYTDSIGTDARNLKLSKQRADAVADVLAAERSDLTLKVKGHGETDPVAQNEIDGDDNPAGRALNRRVEVTYPTA